MRVVSNTSPISNLAIIGRLSLLRQRYGRVTALLAVARELRALSHVPARETIDAAFHEGWLAVESVPTPSALEELRRTLDAGEAEAIALAVAVQPIPEGARARFRGRRIPEEWHPSVRAAELSSLGL
jgi:uncharacterized protein